MTRKRKIAVAVVVSLAAGAACVLAAVDHLLSQPDRIAAAKREALDMVEANAEWSVPW